MTSILSVFGFPPPEKRDSVRFHFAKNLPYNVRIYLILFLLVAGFILQLYYMNPLYGIPLLLIGTGLALVKGYDSRVRMKGFNLDPNWKTVSMEKIKEIELLRKRSKKWDRDALDISNPLGFFSLFLFGALALIASVILGDLAKDTRVTIILAVDVAIIMIPLWFSGMKFILKQPNLIVKIRIILSLYELFGSLKQEGEEFRPALMLSRDKDNNTIPVDARFSVVFPDSPEAFYGLQAQINLNVVQGASYPYFYCVLASKPGFGMSRYIQEIKTSPKIICEYQEDSRAEVLVIRQYTTKKSGYHTKDRQCADILSVALEGGRLIKKDIPQP